MSRNNINIAAIQETKLNASIDFTSYGDYYIHRRDRPHGLGRGGGIAFVIKKSVFFRPVADTPSPTPDEHLEYMSIAIKAGSNEIRLTNIYIPPVNSIGADYTPSIKHLLQGDDHIILGDFNAHHELWFSRLRNDTRGTSLVDQIEPSDFVIINEDSPTRITNTCSSSPDITLVSSNLFDSVEWRTAIRLSSDHIPIHVTVSEPNAFTEAEKRTYVNFNKADWPKFAEYVDRKLYNTPSPSDARHGEKILRQIIVEAAKKHIPAGRTQLSGGSHPD